ncbi:hypothetical protein OUZ56_028314 [Daphnia magna]|uniref:Uncharacterized protein n=1 Tax=Daphnia magna TaxID=35525 RepID=A0ABR0B3L3_9CRUS|nr:hypothetical protein OUZ56_028314 [Daphnia magna]
MDCVPICFINSPTFQGLRGVAAFFFIQRQWQQCIREQSKGIRSSPTQHPERGLLACFPQSQFV